MNIARMTPDTHLRSIIMKTIQLYATLLISRCVSTSLAFSREYFASCVTVSIGSRRFVVFGCIRDSTSHEYTSNVSVTLGLNAFCVAYITR